MKKYIFIDIDGTLTDSNKKVSTDNIKAMKEIEKKDSEIVFCSGRSNNYLINLSKKCQVSRYLISSNGSMIYDQRKKEIIHLNRIPFAILEKLYKYCQQEEIALTFNTEKDRYCNKYLKKIDKEDLIINSITEIKDKNITQVVIGSYDYNKMMNVNKEIKEIDKIEIANISTTIKLNLTNSKDGFFYDVVMKNINKGTGITSFLNIFSIKKEDCIAIGDHVNDIDMFNAVNYKIAMGNAWDELKEKADFITKTNDEDGVKYALEHVEKEFL